MPNKKLIFRLIIHAGGGGRICGIYDHKLQLFMGAWHSGKQISKHQLITDYIKHA